MNWQPNEFNLFMWLLTFLFYFIEDYTAKNSACDDLYFCQMSANLNQIMCGFLGWF